jgi:Rieske Fe-S protein
MQQVDSYWFFMSSHIPDNTASTNTQHTSMSADATRSQIVAEESTEISRREFLAGFSSCLLSVAGAAVLAGCGSGEDKEAAELKRLGILVPVDAQAQPDGSFLVPGGGALQADTALAFTMNSAEQQGLLLAKEDGALIAVSRVCTHMKCPVEWNVQNKERLVCPCHGSQFDVNGRVLNGPATKNLPRYKVQRDGENALVTLT